jgi:hypothetical protein
MEEYFEAIPTIVPEKKTYTLFEELTETNDMNSERLKSK